ncbi:TIM21-domain-containing protein [Xylona heveae TC161]|uniref:Mitochondrial import inner membrane translocase subunit Tim21 n=1 Tax=Xylona heveae (strain CBS 132557 / TC161) TaxID=1328760 RepID=A0A165IV82_XYLHT|nr:TIM21-domain-containing protein [Xylona heveae TC161]KZF25435.1 TIM21-domain-containing protein [Xylona heveae TC161]
MISQQYCSLFRSSWKVQPRLLSTIQTRLALGHSPRLAQSYATQSSLGGSSGSSRKQVSIASDDGRVRWGELTAREKAARTTQQSINFLAIIAGVVGTGAVAVFLYTDVFSPESKTNHFNRAVDRVKADSRCVELLGDSKKIKAHGEGQTTSNWAMARPIASTVQKDRTGTEHLLMHFHVEGPIDKGVVSLHMTKRPGQHEFEYKYLALDVKGHQRLYLENADARPDGSGKSSGKLFGVRWW